MKLEDKEIWYRVRVGNDLNKEVERLRKMVLECPIEIDGSFYSDEIDFYLKKIRISGKEGGKSRGYEMIILLDFYNKIERETEFEKIIRIEDEKVNIRRLSKKEFKRVRDLNKDFFKKKQGIEISYKSYRGKKNKRRKILLVL